MHRAVSVANVINVRRRQSRISTGIMVKIIKYTVCDSSTSYERTFQVQFVIIVKD